MKRLIVPLLLGIIVGILATAILVYPPKVGDDDRVTHGSVGPGLRVGDQRKP